MSLTFNPMNRLMTAAKQAGNVMFSGKPGIPQVPQANTALPPQQEDSVVFSGKKTEPVKAKQVQFGEVAGYDYPNGRPSFTMDDTPTWEANRNIDYKHSYYQIDQTGVDPNKKYRFWDKSPETEVVKLLKDYKALAKNFEQASMYPVDQKHPLIRMIVKMGETMPNTPDAHLRVAYSVFDGILGTVLSRPRNWDQARKLVDHHIPALLQQSVKQSDPLQYWEKLQRMMLDMSGSYANRDMLAFSDFLLESGYDSVYFRELINIAVHPEHQSSTQLIENWLMNPAVMNSVRGETLGVITTWPPELFSAFPENEQAEFMQLVFLLATLPMDMSTIGLAMTDLEDRLNPKSFQQTREAMLDTLTSIYADYQEVIPKSWVDRFRTYLRGANESNRGEWIGLMDQYRTNTNITPARQKVIQEFLGHGMKMNLPASENAVISTLADLPAPAATWNKITRTLLSDLENGRQVTLPEIYTQYLDNSKQRDPIWETRIEQAIQRSDAAQLLGAAQLKKYFLNNAGSATPKRLELLQQHLTEQIRSGLLLPDVLNSNVTNNYLDRLNRNLPTGTSFTLQQMESSGVLQAYKQLLSLPVSDEEFKTLLQRNTNQPLSKLLIEAASRPGVKVSDEWLQGLQESLSAGEKPDQLYVHMMLHTRGIAQNGRKEAFTNTLNALFTQEARLDKATLPWLKEFLDLPIPDKDWKVLNESLQGAGSSLPQQLHRTMASVMANDAYEFDQDTLTKFASYLREMRDNRAELILMKKASLATQTSVSEDRAKLFRQFLNREFALSYPEQPVSGQGYQLLMEMPVSDKDWKKLVLESGQTGLLDIPGTLAHSFDRLDLSNPKTRTWLAHVSQKYRRTDERFAQIAASAMDCTSVSEGISDTRKKAFHGYLNTLLQNESKPLPGKAEAMSSFLNLPVNDDTWKALLAQVKSGESLDRVILSTLDKLDMTQPNAEKWLRDFTVGKKKTDNSQWAYLEVLRQTYEPGSELSDTRKQGLRELIGSLVLGGQTNLTGSTDLTGVLQKGLTQGLSDNKQLNKLLLFAHLPVDDGTWAALNNELKQSVDQGNSVNLEPLLLKVATDDSTSENAQWLGLMQEYLKEDPGSLYLQLKKDVAESDVPDSRKDTFQQLLNRLFEKRAFYGPDETLAKRFNLLLKMPVEESAWQELVQKLTSRTQEEVALGSMPNMVLLAVGSLKDSAEARNWLTEFESFTSKTEPIYQPFLKMRASLEEATPDIRSNRGALFTEILSEVIRNQYMPDPTTADRYKLLLEMPIPHSKWQPMAQGIINDIRSGQPVSSLDMLMDAVNDPANDFATPQGLQWLDQMEELLNRVDQPEQAGHVSLKRLMSSGKDVISEVRRNGLQNLLDKTRNLPVSGERLQNLSLFAKLPVSDAYWNLLYGNLSTQQPENIGSTLSELLEQALTDPGVELTPEWTADYQQVLRQTGRQGMISQLELQQGVMKTLKGAAKERQVTLQKLVGKMIESGQAVDNAETQKLLNLLADWPASKAQWQTMCGTLMDDLEARRGSLPELVNTAIKQNFFSMVDSQQLTTVWLEKFSAYLQAHVGSTAGNDLQQTARLMSKALANNVFSQNPERKQPFFQLLGTLYANDYKLESTFGDILLTYAQLPVPQNTWQATTKELVQKAQSNSSLGVPELITRDLYNNLQQAEISVDWIKNLGNQLKSVNYDNQTVLKQLKALSTFAELGQTLPKARLDALKVLEARLPQDEDSKARNLAFVSMPVSDATWNRLFEMTQQVDSSNGPVLMEEMMLAALSFDSLSRGWSSFAMGLIGREKALEKRQQMLDVKQVISAPGGSSPQQLAQLLESYRGSFFIRYFMELASELGQNQKSPGYLLLRAALGDDKAFSVASRNASVDQLMPAIQERALNTDVKGQDKNQAELMDLLNKTARPDQQGDILLALSAMSTNPGAMGRRAAADVNQLAAVLGKVGSIALNFEALTQQGVQSTQDATVVVRPGFVVISAPSMGTLVIRNSKDGSPDRAALPQTAYYSPATVGAQEIAQLDPANDARFESLLNDDLYNQPMALGKLTFLLDQLNSSLRY